MENQETLTQKDRMLTFVDAHGGSDDAYNWAARADVAASLADMLGSAPPTRLLWIARKLGYTKQERDAAVHASVRRAVDAVVTALRSVGLDDHADAIASPDATAGAYVSAWCAIGRRRDIVTSFATRHLDEAVLRAMGAAFPLGDSPGFPSGFILAPPEPAGTSLYMVPPSQDGHYDLAENAVYAYRHAAGDQDSEDLCAADIRAALPDLAERLAAAIGA